MPTKSTSSTKSKTARANGAKSRGPITPEGRARSSRNSVRHGLATRAAALPPTSVVLPAESAADFQRLLDSYLDEFAPASPVEVELVETMAAARWRLRRLAAIETTLLGNEIERSARSIENDFERLGRHPDEADRLACAFRDLSDGQTLNLLIRYEGALSRSYGRAFKQLQVLQSLRNRPQPNEPKQSLQSLPVEPLGDRVEPSGDRESAPKSGSLPAAEFTRGAVRRPACDNGTSPTYK
jgi:hypothetical protein